MSSGRYTAYHIYQNLSFPEAQKAATWPYRLPEYQCRHSQRGYLFQFENMVERIHFDAANTSCCTEPVLNFANKPQYAEASSPMNPQNCGAKVKATGCTVLEVHVESTNAFCAQSSPKITRIKIKCPSQCPDLLAIQGGGKLEGTYGEFRSLGMEAGDVMILEYKLDPSVVSDWYDRCSGAGTLTEEFCGGFTLSYTLRGGLNYPSGCGCDCCGQHGSFPPPAMIVSAPSSINADWSNTVTIGGEISGDESCSGGNLTGTFYGTGGSSAVQWDGAAQYHSNGFTRLITRDPGSAGSSGNSTCCGGSIVWGGTDGCGGGNNASTEVNARIGASTIIPASGTTFSEHGEGVFSGSGACSYATGADLGITRSCLTNSIASIERYDGYVKRRLTGQLTFSGTHACSGCCGAGSVSVSFNKGCDENYQASYFVRRSYSDAGLVGYAYRCQNYWAGGELRYKIARANVYCNGTSGAFSMDVFGDYYTTLQECVSGIGGTNAPAIKGAGGCSGTLSGGTSCCWYSNNGLSGYDFRAGVYSVSGSRCCHLETQSGSWVFSGSGYTCCPVM